MAKGQQAFGHGQLAQQLAARLRGHFADESADASLVIGIFGEWGSGKSNLLQLVHVAFKAESQAPDRPPVIVVPFNPWRYEKEEHLLVPLLKTMQRETLRYAEEHLHLLERIGLSKESPRRIARFFGVSALAFAKAIKVKGEIPGLGAAEFSFKDFIDKGAEAFKDNRPPLELLDNLESYYFEFEQKLRGITTGKEPIRLLFLIDDLDRCLPEKAVEMLESIKLFLDVEGCAFVLAIDDEVVERGIIHRYRDYLFQGKHADGSGLLLSQMPITGTEYLEKIIQLPFRLPLPSKHEIRVFLQNAYPLLFAESADQRKAMEPEEYARRARADAGELLKLFVDHVPPVPRKHLRAVELLMLQLDIANARGCASRIKPLPLAKLILLQLFAPDLYRFGRRRHAGFMGNLQEWARKNPDWERNTHTFEKSLEEQIEVLPEEQKAGERRLLDRLYKPLIEALESAAHNRSGFDPFRLIRDMPFSSTDLQDLHHYFSFFEESVVVLNTTGMSSENRFRQATVSGDEVRPLASFANATDFLDLLFSTSAANWQAAALLPEVVGRVLDDAIFSAVLDRLDQEAFKAFLQKREWLSLLLPLLANEQFKKLAQKADLAALLAEGPWEERAALLVAMPPEQRQAFTSAVSPLQQELLGKAQNDQESMLVRARAGRLLGDSGWLPEDLETMMPIKAAPFLCGDEKETASIDKDYWIGKYPVTNAQYRRFVEARGYETKEFWSKRGWAWRDKGKIQSPEYWEDRKFANPLSPVVGVSCHEAEAYCRWSQSRMRDNPAPCGLPQGEVGTLVCRLPSNDEWERAARGQDGWIYPWPGEFSAANANCRESWASADGEERGTTAVNIFPQGISPGGLFDCAGNVWEWTSSTSGDGSYYLRGGAWSNVAENLRCAIRFRYHPDFRLDNLGFRLALSS